MGYIVSDAVPDAMGAIAHLGVSKSHEQCAMSSLRGVYT